MSSVLRNASLTELICNYQCGFWEDSRCFLNDPLIFTKIENLSASKGIEKIEKFCARMKPWVSRHGVAHVKLFIELYPPLAMCFCVYGLATADRAILDIVGPNLYQQLDTAIVNICVHYNHWDLLLELQLPSSCISHLIGMACEHSKVDVLRTLYERYRNTQEANLFEYYFGSLEVIQFFQHETTLPRPDETFLRAPAYENLEIVKYLVENGFVNFSTTATAFSTEPNVALEILIYINEHDVAHSWNFAVDSAAILGHDAIVEYLLTHRPEDFDDSSLVKVIKNGHLKCLELLIEHRRRQQNNQWQPPVECIVAAVESNNEEIRAYLHPLVIWPAIYMNTAAQEGNLQLVKSLHEANYFSCTKAAMDKAASKGYLDIVQFLHENRNEGCTECAIDSAAGNGHLDVVQYLLDHKLAKPTMFAMTWAAVGGHLHVIKYLYEIYHAPYCMDIGDRAAKSGHLQVVQYLTEHNIGKWSKAALNGAAARGNLALVQYLDQNRTEGCTTFAVNEAARNGHLEVVEYLLSHRNEGGTQMGVNDAITFGHLKVIFFFADKGYDVLLGIKKTKATYLGLEEYIKYHYNNPAKRRRLNKPSS